MKEGADGISEFLSVIPFSSMLSENRLILLRAAWKKSGQSMPLESALNACIAASFAFPLIFFATLLVIFPLPLAGSFAYSLILFAFLLLATFRLPAILAKRHAAEIESDLPMALRELSLHIRIKTPFEKSLLAVSTSGYGSSKIFAEASSAISGGATVQSALLAASESADSLHFSRAMSQLSVIYEEGGDTHALLSLADEIASTQASRAREFGSKAAFFGLLYVAASALLPAFFLIAAVGAGPLGASFATPNTVFIFYLLAVPLLDICVLILIHFSAPPTLAQIRKDADDALLDSICESSHFPRIRTLHLPLTLAFAIAGIAIALIFSFSSLGIFLAMLITAIPSALLGYVQFIASSRIAQMENSLPPAILAASSQPRSFSLEKSLALMAKSSNGALSEEISSLSRQISAGTQVQKAISEASHRTPSMLWSRCLSLLLVGYKTGANMQQALRATADDILLVFSLVRERAAASSLQRYTLLGATLLVPIILATVLSFATSLAQAYSSTSAASSFNLGGASAQEISAIVSAAAPACQSYLLIYSIITAFFLSLQEGRRDKLFFYAAALSLLSQIVWILARGG